jgi:hypothetical protein
VLEVVTESRVSYACENCEDGGEDCRCSDEGEVHYFIGPRNELLLALIPTWVEAGRLAAFPQDAPELRERDDSLTSTERGLIRVMGRRLRLVCGALVPAP